MKLNNTSPEEGTFRARLKQQGFLVNSELEEDAVLLDEIRLSPSSLRLGRYIFSGPVEVRYHPKNKDPFLRAKAKAVLLIDNKEYLDEKEFTVSTLLSSLSTGYILDKPVSGDSFLKDRKYARLQVIDKKKRFIEEFVLDREVEVIEVREVNVVTWRWTAPIEHVSI